MNSLITAELSQPLSEGNPFDDGVAVSRKRKRVSDSDKVSSEELELFQSFVNAVKGESRAHTLTLRPFRKMGPEELAGLRQIIISNYSYTPFYVYSVPKLRCSSLKEIPYAAEIKEKQ